jgi:DNA helicase IV
MDIKLLIDLLASCLPFLLSVGNKAVEGASQKVGEDTWNKAKAIWSQLRPKVEDKEAAKEAVEDVAKNPDDRDLQTALRVQLKKILDSDPTLAAKIAQILQEESTTATDSNKIEQYVVDSTDNQVIGSMQGEAKAVRDVHGNVYM